LLSLAHDFLLSEAHPMRRSLKQAASVPALLAVAVFVLPGAGSFTEAEFQCEEAAITLDDCCAELATSSLSCSRQTGCSGETTRPPVLTVAESECIEDLECDALVAAGICERVDARQSELENNGGNFSEAVCP
jgi:hypothetical protein